MAAISALTTTTAIGMFVPTTTGGVQGYRRPNVAWSELEEGGRVSKGQGPFFGGMPIKVSPGNLGDLTANGEGARYGTPLSKIQKALDIGGWTVFSGVNLQIEPGHDAGLAFDNDNIGFFRKGSRAEIYVACDAALRDAFAEDPATQIGWDVLQNRLVVYTGSGSGGAPLEAESIQIGAATKAVKASDASVQLDIVEENIPDGFTPSPNVPPVVVDQNGLILQGATYTPGTPAGSGTTPFTKKGATGKVTADIAKGEKNGSLTLDAGQIPNNATDLTASNLTIAGISNPTNLTISGNVVSFQCDATADVVSANTAGTADIAGNTPSNTPATPATLTFGPDGSPSAYAKGASFGITQAGTITEDDGEPDSIIGPIDIQIQEFVTGPNTWVVDYEQGNNYADFILSGQGKAVGTILAQIQV